MRSFAYGAFCVALLAAACGSDDEKRVEHEGDAGAGGEAPSGGSSSAGSPTTGEAGEGAAAQGGAPLGGSAGEGANSGNGGSSGSAGTAGSGGTNSGRPVSVTGQVVDSRGRPLAGVRVEVAGEAVTSGADGAFVAEAVIPYDIVVRVSDEETDVYLGVERTDPKIVGFANVNRSATLAGTLSGVGYPVPAGHETELTLRGVDVGFSNRQSAGSTGAYTSSGSPAWSGGETTQATLFALQRNTTTGAFTAIGSKQVTLTNGQQLASPAADLTLVAAVSRDLDVTINAPAGVDFSSFVFFVGSVPVVVDEPSAAFTVQVPEDVPEDVGFVLNFDATLGGRRTYAIARVPSTADSLELDIGVPPAATSPANNATLNAANGAFRFTPEAGAVSRLVFVYTESLSGGELLIDHTTNVMTDEVNVPLSRLLGLDLDLPEGENIAWTLQSRADAPTVDDYLAPTHDPGANLRGGQDAQRRFSFQE